ncbi:MAG: MFS transporter [Hyphomicrobiales bacterium]|nr:MFS transporter [Hyphomicrobiales bacterium]
MVLSLNFPSLKSKEFQKYTAGNFFAMNGIWINRVIIGWLGWELTNLASWVGILSFLLFAPTIITGPYFGVLIDRIDIKKFAVYTQSIISLTVFALWFLYYFSFLNIYSLCLVALIIGIFTSADRTTRMAIVPRIVDKEYLANAIAVHGINFNCARLIGPALAGIMIKIFGFNTTIFINFLFLIAMPLVLMVIEVRQRDSISKGKKNIFSEFIDGANYAFNHSVIFEACAITAVFSLFARGTVEILPAIAGGVFNAGADGLGQMMATAGAGALIAAIFIAMRRSKDQEKGIPLRVYFASFLGLLAAIILAVSNSWNTALFSVFFIGFSMTITGIDLQAVVQLELNDTFRGRVMSLWVVLVIGLAAFSAILMGILGDLVGILNTLVIFSLLGIISLITLLLLLKKKF